MAWLYTLTVLFTILILILFAPINVIFEYNENSKIKIKFMGIPFPAFSNISKKNKSPNQATRKSKKRPTKDILKSIGNIGNLLKVAKDSLVCVSKKISIDTLRLVLCIGAEDAAEAAIKYGQASAIVYPTLSIINALSKPKELFINIVPNFPNEKINIDFKIKLKSSIFNLVALAIILFKKYKEII